MITVTTQSLDEARTNSITVNVDDASKVVFQRNYEDVTLQNGANTVKFSDKENSFSLSGVNSLPLNEVKLNGTVQEDTYGYASWSWYKELKTGDVIDITALFPDEDHTLTITCTDPKVQLGELIKQITVNTVNKDLTSVDFTQPISLKLGDKVEITADTELFNVNSLTVNGEQMSYFTGTWTASPLKENTTLVFDAEKKVQQSATIHLNDASLVKIYKGQGTYGDLLTADQDNNVNFTWMSGDNSTFTVAPQGKVSIAVICDGEELTSDYASGGKSYTAENGKTYEVNAEAATPTGKFTIICYSNDSDPISNSSFSMSGTVYRQIEVNTGNGAKTEVPFYEDDMAFTPSFHHGTYSTTNNSVYLNNTKVNDDGGGGYAFRLDGKGTPNIVDGDIVRLYAGIEGVETMDMTITEATDVASDGFTAKIDGLQSIDLSTGTATVPLVTRAKVMIYLPQGKQAADYKVTLQGEELIYSDAEGCYETEAVKDGVINIQKAAATGISSIANDSINGAEKIVYSVSGVRLSADKPLRKGVYIINGKKVLK